MTVWLLRTQAVTEADGETLRERFPERMARADRLRGPGDRQRSIGAGLLRRDARGVSEEGLLREGPEGKLSLPGGPEFNLSHSGDWIVLALDPLPLGVDVECLEPQQLRAALRVSGPEERAWLGSDLDRATRLWTWKEARLKATGQGFALDPCGLNVLPFLHRAAVEAEGRAWYGAELSLGGGYRLGMASAAPIEHISLRRLR